MQRQCGIRVIAFWQAWSFVHLEWTHIGQYPFQSNLGGAISCQGSCLVVSICACLWQRPPYSACETKGLLSPAERLSLERPNLQCRQIMESQDVQRYTFSCKYFGGLCIQSRLILSSWLLTESQFQRAMGCGVELTAIILMCSLKMKWSLAKKLLPFCPWWCLRWIGPHQQQQWDNVSDLQHLLSKAQKQEEEQAGCRLKYTAYCFCSYSTVLPHKGTGMFRREQNIMYHDTLHTTFQQQGDNSRLSTIPKGAHTILIICVMRQITDFGAPWDFEKVVCVNAHLHLPSREISFACWMLASANLGKIVLNQEKTSNWPSMVPFSWTTVISKKCLLLTIMCTSVTAKCLFQMRVSLSLTISLLDRACESL